MVELKMIYPIHAKLAGNWKVGRLHTLKGKPYA